METGITYCGVDLWIEFTIEGAHYPATREQPEEQPELELNKILAGDVDILAILLEQQIDDIYNLLIDEIE